MCSNLVKCMIFERNKELMWLKIINISLKQICVRETKISFLKLRPVLLVNGIKVWDWDFPLWPQISRLRLLHVSRIEIGLKAWELDWDHPNLSLSLETKVLLSSVDLGLRTWRFVIKSVICQWWQMTDDGHKW